MKRYTYHKINAPFKRDMGSKGCPIIMNDWAVPEFEMLKNIEWIGHEKIDGTNIRIHFNGETIEFGGRTEGADIPKHLLLELHEIFTVDKMIKVFGELESGEVATLYGEGYGHKIQKGGKYLSDKKVSFILFDIKVGSWWLKPESLKEISESLNIKHAPYVGTGTLEHFFEMVSYGHQSAFGDFYAEGIVVTPLCELFDRAGRRIITKIKHKDFFGRI